MELIGLSYCGVMVLGIFIGYFLSRKQDDRGVEILPTKAPKEIEDEMFRCMHTPEELQDMKDHRITTDGRV